ncbi:MAG: aquaporin family protein [Actinobacteria bacterium]|nr:MAG: aquaporin family protein [Actinomycetota bacterium]
MVRSLSRRALAEFIGTGLLVTAVVGSGIAAARLSPGNLGLELFENAAATGAALVAIILAVGPVSGAHLNPIITLVDRAFGGSTSRDAIAYLGAQFAGASVGAIVANSMFGLGAIEISQHARSGGGLWVGEGVATFGLLLVVFGLVRSHRTGVAPLAVGAYIGAAYFFTSSTSFANPAVTVARTLSDTFSGIAPSSVLAFVVFQLIGGAIAAGTIGVLYPDPSRSARDVLVPHETSASAIQPEEVP